MAYLQSDGENDVGVHGPHIQMVDDGILQAVGTVPQHGQFVHNVTAHLVITQPCHCTPGDHTNMSLHTWWSHNHVTAHLVITQSCHCTPGDQTMSLHTWWSHNYVTVHPVITQPCHLTSGDHTTMSLNSCQSHYHAIANLSNFTTMLLHSSQS